MARQLPKLCAHGVVASSRLEVMGSFGHQVSGALEHVWGAVGEDCVEVAGFVVEGVPRVGVEGFERADLDAGGAPFPHACNSSVDQYCREHVAVSSDDMGSVVVGDDPASVAVGEKRAIPHGHQPWWGQVIGVGEFGCVGEIEQLVALDGAVVDEFRRAGIRAPAEQPTLAAG